jgi:hypothetical protein
MLLKISRVLGVDGVVAVAIDTKSQINYIPIVRPAGQAKTNIAATDVRETFYDDSP